MAGRDQGPFAEAAYSAGANALVFIGFVAAGCGYIILAKLRPVEQLYVTFVPVAIMLGYALLISLARRLQLRDDQSGDNLYYMGFLFTLTSLGVSLYQFSAARAAEQIVQNFGIAIASTIAGIGLRVVFNQMRRDPVEVERMVRLELAEAARRVRRELDSAVVEFGYFRRTAHQSTADSFKEMTVKFDEVAVRFAASLEQIATKLARPVEAASQRSGEAIAELTRTVGETLAASGEKLSAETQRLSSRTGAIATALEDVTGRLNAMQTPDRVIEVRLEPMADALAQAVAGIAAQSDAQAKAVKEALQMANAATQRSSDLINVLRREIDVTTVGNREAVEASTKIIATMAEVLEQIKAGSSAYVEVLASMLEKADGTMRTFTDVLVQSGVEAATRTDRLSEALPAIEARAQTLAVAADRISRVVEELRARRARPERETID